MGDFNSTREVKARKAHKCGECHRTIGVGEIYLRTAAVWEGDFFTFVTCAHCDAMRPIAQDLIGRFDEVYYGGLGELMEELRLDATDVTAITRLIACTRQRWRYPSGRLMPVPTRGASE